jgi:hypothetical protein
VTTGYAYGRKSGHWLTTGVQQRPLVEHRGDTETTSGAKGRNSGHWLSTGGETLKTG